MVHARDYGGKTIIAQIILGNDDYRAKYLGKCFMPQRIMGEMMIIAQSILGKVVMPQRIMDKIDDCSAKHLGKGFYAAKDYGER
jgi:hypothetical protein